MLAMAGSTKVSTFAGACAFSFAASCSMLSMSEYACETMPHSLLNTFRYTRSMGGIEYPDTPNGCNASISFKSRSYTLLTIFVCRSENDVVAGEL